MSAVQASDEPALADKVAFLSRCETYSRPNGPAPRRETHMSWVFFAGDKVYKLKKPVRFPYLDFSTLPHREAACREELRINRRLAPDVYLGVAPLVETPQGLSINGTGEVVDCLVVMRRLDESHTLEHRLDNHVQDRELDALATVLARFYRHARPVMRSVPRHVADWREMLAYDRRILLDPRFGLPSPRIRHIHRVLQRFLETRRQLLAERVRARRIVDAHGDLRPEHIWLDDGIRIIDRLEFSARLRANDPLDELAYLDLECEVLGAPQAGARIRRKALFALHDEAPQALYLFYRCCRASLRARLAIAHLLEPEPRTPDKWPRRARRYLEIAAVDAERLQRSLSRPGDSPAIGARAAARWSRPARTQRAGSGPCRAPDPP